MDECVVEVDEERNVLTAASRKLAVWLRASSPPKRSFRGLGRFGSDKWGQSRGQGEARPVVSENRRWTENWRGKRVVFSSDVTSGLHDVGAPKNTEKEMSSQAMEMTECMVSNMENVTSLTRGVHGMKENSDSFINPAPDDGIAKPNDLCTVSGQDFGPYIGLSKEISSVLEDSSQLGMGDGPVLHDSKTTSPSYGFGRTVNDIGQGVEANISNFASLKTGKWKRLDQSRRLEATCEIFGKESGKRRIDKVQNEECKRSRRISSHSSEDRGSISVSFPSDSPSLAGMTPVGVCDAGNSLGMDSKCVEEASLVDNVPIDGMCEANQNFLVDYDRHTQGKKHIHFASPLCAVNWIPPDRGKFKMNCAFSINSRHERIGIGVIVRDCAGEVLACCSQRLEAKLGNKEANLMAIFKGLLFGIDCGLSPQVIELDDKEVVGWINSGSHVDSAFGAILMEIKMLMEDMDGLLVQYVPKLANKAAQGLSEVAFSMLEDMFWLEEFPICICTVIDSEKPC
ncbi:hypothetical protein LWI29_022474 [Acer saccharum]|uniref:RNase H type-1 domain-containing protein n=1 Tax=Acer saccharum TaxID=4024 RepID=A0AA39V928_ACESA|nr:hypothetical protein LWI29_022474 [Acer saccharum]